MLSFFLYCCTTATKPKSNPTIMHQSILYFYLAALSLAAANPLPYDPSEPLIDDADLNEFPLDPTNLFFVAQAAQDESGPSTNLDAPKIFCESGWLRTCCSFTKKNFNKRSGLYYHDCMSFPRGTSLSFPHPIPLSPPFSPPPPLPIPTLPLPKTHTSHPRQRSLRHRIRDQHHPAPSRHRTRRRPLLQGSPRRAPEQYGRVVVSGE